MNMMSMLHTYANNAENTVVKYHLRPLLHSKEMIKHHHS